MPRAFFRLCISETSDIEGILQGWLEHVIYKSHQGTT